MDVHGLTHLTGLFGPVGSHVRFRGWVGIDMAAILDGQLMDVCAAVVSLHVALCFISNCRGVLPSNPTSVICALFVTRVLFLFRNIGLTYHGFPFWDNIELYWVCIQRRAQL
jgi:hypothetical protein